MVLFSGTENESTRVASWVNHSLSWPQHGFSVHTNPPRSAYQKDNWGQACLHLLQGFLRPCFPAGLPMFWFLLVITSALQSATRLYCLTTWRPSKWNPNPPGVWPLLPQCGFCKLHAITAPQLVFFILFIFETQPTNLNPMLRPSRVECDPCTPPPTCPGHGSPCRICPGGFWVQWGLGATPLPSKSQVLPPRSSVQGHSQPAFASGYKSPDTLHSQICGKQIKAWLLSLPTSPTFMP